MFLESKLRSVEHYEFGLSLSCLSSRRCLRPELVRYVKYPPTAITARKARIYIIIDEPIRNDAPIIGVESMSNLQLRFISNYASVLFHCKVNKFSSGVSSSDRKRAA